MATKRSADSEKNDSSEEECIGPMPDGNTQAKRKRCMCNSIGVANFVFVLVGCKYPNYRSFVLISLRVHHTVFVR